MIAVSLITLAALGATEPPSRRAAEPSIADTDTILTVSPGTRLRLENMTGEITITAWDRNQVRIQASHGRSTRVEIRRAGAELSVEASGRFGPGGEVDYDITVPAWMPLRLTAMAGDITVTGTRAAIEAEAMAGDLTVTGGSETLKLGAMAGDLQVSGARGKLELSNMGGDILVEDFQGDLNVDAVSGDVILREIRTALAEVSTVSGDVMFDGAIQNGGRYALSSHSGDVVIGLAEGVNATVTAQWFNGDLRARFPLPQTESTGRRSQRFRFGNGSAIVELETFSGDVVLMRPAELAALLRERRGR
ncbi:MAG: DUF4097 family beta strand repeat-containing protein [Gemmatimonadales bacterium]